MRAATLACHAAAGLLAASRNSGVVVNGGAVALSQASRMLPSAEALCRSATALVTQKEGKGTKDGGAVKGPN
eukprot:6883546-Karenia_brevis.AAC.1